MEVTSSSSDLDLLDEATTTAKVRDSVDRILGLLFGVGALLLTPLFLPALWRDLRTGPWWWQWSSALLLLLISLTCLLGRWIPARWFRPLWRFLALAGLLMMVSWAFETPDSERVPWIYYSYIVLVGTAAVGWNWTGAVIYVVILATLLPALEYVGAVDLPTASWVAAPSLQLTNLSILAMVQGARVQLTKYRTAVDQVLSQRARAERAKTRLAQQTEVAAIIHDEVLSALLAIAGPDRESSESVRQVEMALAALDTDNPAGGAEPLPFDQRLVHLASRLEPGVHVVIESIETPLEPDPETASTLLAVAGEALRNIRRHVLQREPDAGRWMTLRRESRSLLLEICDEGGGFDIDAVNPERIGLQKSILGRMQMLPGGFAQIESRPGQGTRVILRWEPPQ